MDNYEILVQRAETAFDSKKYLEAFLIQSCIFEGVIKDYAAFVLKPILSKNDELKRKINNLEVARLVDMMFVAGKITGELYTNLNNYRKKRNKVIHQVMNFKGVKVFEKELKTAYLSGRHMKGFVVDEMVRMQAGKTLAEVGAELEKNLGQFQNDMEGAFNREIVPMAWKMNRDIEKFLKTSSKKKVVKKGKKQASGRS